MKKITKYEDFGLNESVVGKFTTVSEEDLKLVSGAKLEDFSDDDTPKRKAIINCLEAAYNYFEMKDTKSTDVRTKIVGASGDDANRKKLFDLAKTFASSLNKIKKIETSEIEPVGDQISTIIS